jgi:hypothetical protein
VVSNTALSADKPIENEEVAERSILCASRLSFLTGRPAVDIMLRLSSPWESRV